MNDDFFLHPLGAQLGFAIVKAQIWNQNVAEISLFHSIFFL